MSQRQGQAEKNAAKKSKKGGQKITRMTTNTRDEVRQAKTPHKQSRQPGG